MNPIEPSADIRQAAHALREMYLEIGLYLALIAEGHTDSSARQVIADLIAAITRG